MENKPNVGIPETGQRLVFERGQFNAVHHHRTAVGAVQSRENIEQSGLSGPGRTHDGNHLSCAQRDVHTTQDLEVIVAFVNSGCLQHVRKLRPKANFAAP